MRQRSLVLAAFLTSACSTEIQHDLSEEDANEIYAVLHERGFSPLKERQQGDTALYSIAVPKADVAKAATVLSKRGLPRARQPGFEIFSEQPSVLASPEETHARWIRAVSGTVANAISRMPSVTEARVIVNLPRPDELTLPDSKPAASTASVYVKQSAGQLDVSEDQLKRFVASAVPNLRPQDVSVLTVISVETPDPTPTVELLTPEVLKALVATLSVLLLATASALGTLLLRHRRLLSPVRHPA